MAKTSDTTREAVEGDLHKTSTGVIRGQEDHVGRSTHVVGAPSVSGKAHDQTGQLSGRTQLAMDGDLRSSMARVVARREQVVKLL
nr:unnamed protein product [Callosobruchus chinensis]